MEKNKSKAKAKSKAKPDGKLTPAESKKILEQSMARLRKSKNPKNVKMPVWE